LVNCVSGEAGVSGEIERFFLAIGNAACLGISFEGGQGCLRVGLQLGAFRDVHAVVLVLPLAELGDVKIQFGFFGVGNGCQKKQGRDYKTHGLSLTAG
jgi:hypothetical protein